MADRVPEPVIKIYDLADREQPTTAISASSSRGLRNQSLSDPDSKASTVLTSLFKTKEKKQPGDISKGRVLTSLIHSEEEKKKPGDISKGSVLTSLFKTKEKKKPGDISKGSVLTSLFKSKGKKKPVDTDRSEDSQSLESNHIKEEKDRREPSDKKRRRSQRQDEAVDRAFGVSVEPDEMMKATSCLVCVIVIGACVALIIITIYMFFQPKNQ